MSTFKKAFADAAKAVGTATVSIIDEHAEEAAREPGFIEELFSIVGDDQATRDAKKMRRSLAQHYVAARKNN